jgi:hypothetical protein
LDSRTRHRHLGTAAAPRRTSGSKILGGAQDGASYNPRVTFYGLADYRLSGSDLGEVTEFYSSQQEAEEALRDVLADEPEWQGALGVVGLSSLCRLNKSVHTPPNGNEHAAPVSLF